MNEPSNHESVIELLKRARRRPEEITPEQMEENLRWLIRLARPSAAAPHELRERVRALVEVKRSRRSSRRSRVLDRAWPVRRRVLLQVLPLAAAALLLFLLLAPRAPAQVLARTLVAMAAVETAHSTGWHVNYRRAGYEGAGAPGRMKVEWWYKAPNQYREVVTPVPGDESTSPMLLVVKGNRNRLVSRFRATPGRQVILPPSLLARHLSSLDFFARQGFLRRAQAKSAAQVTEWEGTYSGRSVQIAEVVVPELGSSGNCRQHWILYVEPASDRILRSEVRFECRGQDRAWETRETEILDHFEYNLPLNDRMFNVETPSPPRHSDRDY